MVIAEARRLWELYEPIHDVVYFTPEARSAADGLGLKGYWMGYFAFRAAPLGSVGPAAVTALFHGFHPDRANRALPDAWAQAGPEEALAARLAGSTAALRRLCSTADGAAIDEASDLAWRASQAAEPAGRVLGAANQALGRPADPVGALWQATTTLREHRGDGHVAALVAHDVGPVAAHVLKVAAGETAQGLLRQSRKLTDAEWDPAAEELRRRGWIGVDGTLTAAGRAGRDGIEEATDRAAAGPWTALGPVSTARLSELLRPLTAAVVASGEIPDDSPVGLKRPEQRPRTDES